MLKRGADCRAQNIHFCEISDSAHSLQESTLATREGNEKEDYGKQPDIKSVICVAESNSADLFAREKESRSTEQAEHQTYSSQSKYRVAMVV